MHRKFKKKIESLYITFLKFQFTQKIDTYKILS